jgi:histidinol-phosphate aminotransferase
MKRIKQLIKPSVLAMQSYQVPAANGLTKLDAMENPYPWPDDLKREWLKVISSVELNRYPEAGANTLKASMRKALKVPDGMDIMLGNGSDELIQILALALGGSGRVFMAPEPAFVMYRQISQTVDARFVGVPLMPDDFSLNREAMLSAIAALEPSLIFLARPNNPTGNLFDENLIIEIVQEAQGLVVIDEAYYAFAKETLTEYLPRFENMLIMRTFSKSGLAGLRLGYLMGPRDWLVELDKIRLPYNINVLTQKTVEFILGHSELLEDQAAAICAHREQMFDSLAAIPELSVWPSAANFLLFRSNKQPALEVFEGLKRAGVLIKNLDGSHPLLENCLRVTVGLDTENHRFLEALESLI